MARFWGAVGAQSSSWTTTYRGNAP